MKYKVACFRVDSNADDSLELGMLQVKPIHHHQGIGKFVLSTVESLAKEKGLKSVFIHTTEDNHIAQMLYSSFGYLLTEIGSCTTADNQKKSVIHNRRYSLESRTFQFIKQTVTIRGVLCQIVSSRLFQVTLIIT